MADYGRLVVGVTADTSELSRNIANASTKAGTTAGKSIAGNIGASLRSGVGTAAKAVGNTLATGFTLATSAVIGFGVEAVKAGIEANAAIQEQTLSFKALLGSAKAANTMMAAISKISMQSVFPKGVLVDATRQMIGFGFSAGSIPKTLDAISNAAAATGDTTGASVEAITNALGRVQSTGKFTTRTFATLGKQGIDAGKLIGDQMGLTGQQVRAQLTSGALGGQKALRLLTIGMGKTYADAGKEVLNTWNGVKIMLGKATTGIGREIVEPFISAKGGGYAVVWGQKVLASLRALAPGVQRVMNAVMQSIGPTLNKVGPILDRITKMIARFGAGGQLTGLTSSLTAMGPLVAGLAGVFAKGGGNIAEALGPLGKIIPTALFNPWVAGVAALVATNPAMQQAFGSILASMKPLLGVVAQLATTISSALAPVLTDLAPVIATVGVELVQAMIPALAALIPLVKVIAPLLADFAKVLGVILSNRAVAAVILATVAALMGFEKVIAIVKGLRVAWVALQLAFAISPWGVIIVGAIALGVALVELYRHSATFRAIVQGAFRAVAAAGLAMWAALKTAFRAITAAVSATFGWIKTHWPLLVGILGGPLALAAVEVAKHWAAIKRTITAALSAILSAVRRTMGTVRSVVGSAMSAVRGVVASAWKAITSVVRSAASTVVGVVRAMVGGVRSAASGIRSALAAPFQAAVHTIGSAVGSIRGRVTGALSGASGWLVGAGQAIVHGLISGIGSLKGAVTSALLALIPGPLKKFAGKLGIASPSKVFHGFGQNIVEGLINGIASLQAPLDRRVQGLVGVPRVPSPAIGSAAGRAARSVRPGGLGAGATVNVYPRASQSEMAIAAATSRQLGWAARTA
jgi:phage-related protein